MMTNKERAAKLRKLAGIEGFASVQAMLEASVSDCVSPGICCRTGCDYATEVEPDQDRGWCEACGAPGVQSALILAQLI